MKHSLSICFHKVRHYFLSRSKFDIHSPFVYKIYSQVLKDKTDYPEYHTSIKNQTDGGSSLSCKDCRLLFRLSKYFKPKTILIPAKIDSTAALYFTSGFPGTNIISSHESTGLTADTGLSDMVFISGDLPGNHIRDYFSQIMQHIHNDSVLIFCNIHGSKEMHEAWNEIRNHSSITVTIDLFSMGLAFCKEGLTKEDFILRY
jgi:hypothetical protein